MSAPRIILMYISEISGHHSATLAIENALRQLSPEAEILNINAFNYTNPVSERIINRLYMGVIKITPGIWRYLYDNPGIVRRLNGIKDAIHKFNSPKLKKLFESFSPEVIACTQAFPCGMAADFKKTYGSRIPLVAVLTDYVPHSYWIYDDINYYITPSDEVSLRLIHKGVPREKIRSLGIPFDPKFTRPVIREDVTAALGLDADLPTVLIMGGGQGLGPIKTVVGSLEKIKKDFQEIIVTGVNRRLYNSLSRQIKRCKKKTLLYGYVNNIDELMAVSDIIITKPGGVTTAEALGNSIPMIIINPIPGQEANNTAYLIEKGAAVEVARADDINLAVDDLLSHPDKLMRLKESAARIGKPNASIDIARLLLGLTEPPIR